MNRRTAQFFQWLFACTFLVLSGCDAGGPDPGQARTAAPSEPTYQDFGDFGVHFNAVRTDDLSVAVARAYGIERSANRVMLNVSLLRKGADGRATVMMPHPERVFRTVQNSWHPAEWREDGAWLRLFRNARAWVG